MGKSCDLNDNIELDKNHAHTIEVVVDRLVKKPDLQERLADSLTTCLKRSEGIAVIDIVSLPEGAALAPVAENGAGNGKVVALPGRELSIAYRSPPVATAAYRGCSHRNPRGGCH
jgi:excinuclease ABC subunit A